MLRSQTLLVNYWYAHPVGHALEGMRYALGYKAADPDLRVSLLLNGATAVELARLCPFIDEVYAVPYSGFMEPDADPAEALADVPGVWDWIVENHRVGQSSHDGFRGFRAFFDAAHAHLESRHPRGVAGAAPPAYVPHQNLRLDLPSGARAAAAATVGARRPVISVLPAGSSAERHLYPSASSWELILRALSRRYPGAVFLLIGKTMSDGRTTTRVERAEIERLLAAIPGAIDCFDRPLLEQVALVEASNLLVSPHTGFAFVASAVETPWLAISGGNWHEYFFNGEVVYSLLPDPERYPPFAWAGLGDRPLEVIEEDEDGEGARTPSMSIARIHEDLPELLRAVELLIERRLPYEDALADYFPRLLALYEGDRGRAFSFDDLGALYLPRPGH
ncbi:MAG TPA: hypothetical protein VHC01_14080 [Gaiellaceae bacterium]|jgi:hypothetical protein|nr:hypothetical protein [Gaiellaceae bacterium]